MRRTRFSARTPTLTTPEIGELVRQITGGTGRLTGEHLRA